MERKIIVPDMRCEHCVARISGALTAIQADFAIDLPTKTVTVCGEESALQAALDEIYDLGFTPEFERA